MTLGSHPGKYGVGLWKHLAAKFCIGGKPSWGRFASTIRVCLAIAMQGNVNILFRADPAATTAKNTKLPERWAYENNHVGALAELAKVKEVEPDIMDSSLGKLVLKDEEKEWRRQMLEQLTHQNQLIALIAKKTLGSEQVQDNDASEAKC